MIDVGGAIFTGIITGIILFIVIKVGGDLSTLVKLGINGIAVLSILGFTVNILYGGLALSEVITVSVTFIVTMAISGAFAAAIINVARSLPILR